MVRTSSCSANGTVGVRVPVGLLHGSNGGALLWPIRLVIRRARALVHANGRTALPPRERSVASLAQLGGQEQAQFALSDWPWLR